MKEKSVGVKQPLVCSEQISRRQLKEYLFRKKAEAEPDEKISQHLEGLGCAACQWLVDEIEAAEPYLRDDEPLPSPHVEFIQKRPITEKEVVDQEQLIEEVSSKLATAMASPTQEPFSMDALSVMNGRIRSVSNPLKRKAIAEEVIKACKARQRKLGNESAMEAASGKLITFVASDSGRKEVNLEELGLRTDLAVRGFLLYMMTNEWFLNWDGGVTWEWKNPGPNEKGTPQVELRITELKKALDAYAARRDAGPVLA